MKFNTLLNGELGWILLGFVFIPVFIVLMVRCYRCVLFVVAGILPHSVFKAFLNKQLNFSVSRQYHIFEACFFVALILGILTVTYYYA